MSELTREIFEDLAKSEHPDSTTFYIPTFRDTGNEKAKIIFKNQIQAVKKDFESRNKGDKFILQYLEPLYNMLEDPKWWRHLSDGLVVFRHMEFHQSYTIPVHFSDFHYLGNRFYLTPLIPYFNGDGMFYTLAISQKKTRLFEGSRDQIAEIDIKDQIPGQLEDTVGYEFEDKSLQFRTEKTTSRDAQFHGHGAGKEEQKKEVKQFLRDIDKGFTEIAGKQGKPLVVATVDEIFSMYKQVNTYKNLHDKNISGNPDNTSTMLLHEKSWDLLKDLFSEAKQKAIEAFNKNKNSDKSSTDIKEIVTAGVAGNIDILLVAENEQIWGTMDEDKLQVRVDNDSSPENECLIDKTVKAAYLQGGQVFLLKKEELPDNTSPVNAVMRF